MFGWIQQRVYAAFVSGVFRGMTDTGLIVSDETTPERQAAAVKEAIAAGAIEDTETTPTTETAPSRGRKGRVP